jgi:hypothetical protein
MQFNPESIRDDFYDENMFAMESRLQIGSLVRPDCKSGRA